MLARAPQRMRRFKFLPLCTPDARLRVRTSLMIIRPIYNITCLISCGLLQDSSKYLGIKNYVPSLRISISQYILPLPSAYGGLMSTIQGVEYGDTLCQRCFDGSTIDD